jgi:opacity protein-like surface antigen
LAQRAIANAATFRNAEHSKLQDALAPGGSNPDERTGDPEIYMDIKYRMIITLLLASMAMSSPAWAQYGYSGSRGPGWEFGVDGVYQDSSDLSFDGGSKVSVDSDFGLTLVAGYRLNSRLEVSFSFDWQQADYSATIQSADVPGLSADVHGDYEAFTPRANVNYNFLDGPITPYVTGGIGWTFVDTNIPEGRVQVGCWWDPWYGEICVPVQDTHSVDGFAYQLGVGVRWDSSRAFSMRLAYEKHWYDFDNASSTPDFDQLKLGLIWRY